MAEMHETVSFSCGLEEIFISKSQKVKMKPSRERVKKSHEVQEHCDQGKRRVNPTTANVQVKSKSRTCLSLETMGRPSRVDQTVLSARRVKRWYLIP